MKLIKKRGFAYEVVDIEEKAFRNKKNSIAPIKISKSMLKLQNKNPFNDGILFLAAFGKAVL